MYRFLFMCIPTLLCLGITHSANIGDVCTTEHECQERYAVCDIVTAHNVTKCVCPDRYTETKGECVRYFSYKELLITVSVGIGGIVVGVIITVVVFHVRKCRRKSDSQPQKDETELGSRTGGPYDNAKQRADTNSEHLYSTAESIADYDFIESQYVNEALD